jgi:predicted alpha/beta hydrolase family esterase
MIYIFHGRGSNPNRAWIPWLKSQLEEVGHEVKTPQMPFARFPSPKKWENTLDNLVNGNLNNNFIAYSLSSHTVLRYVASSKGNPENIFLVAPFQEIDYDTVYQETIKMTKGIPLPQFMKEGLAKLSKRNSHLWCDTQLPWEQLRDYQDKLHLFFSDNDYYVRPEQIDLFQSRLPNASYNIIENAGHFATADGYTQFPLLLKTVNDTLKGEKKN